MKGEGREESAVNETNAYQGSMRSRVKKKNMYRYIAKTIKLKVCDE
jgi:hypothetical protein